MGAKQLAPIKGVNRNIKLTLVSEAFMRRDDKTLNLKDPNWHIKREDSSDIDRLYVQVFNLLRLRETRELFGLTYRDLIDMDHEAFEYISEVIVKLANERIEHEKQEELKLKNEQSRG